MHYFTCCCMFSRMRLMCRAAVSTEGWWTSPRRPLWSSKKSYTHYITKALFIWSPQCIYTNPYHNRKIFLYYHKAESQAHRGAQIKCQLWGCAEFALHRHILVTLWHWAWSRSFSSSCCFSSISHMNDVWDSTQEMEYLTVHPPIMEINKVQ